MSRPPLPPLTLETAIQRVRLAEAVLTRKWQREHDYRPITEAPRPYPGPAGRRPHDPAGLCALGR